MPATKKKKKEKGKASGINVVVLNEFSGKLGPEGGRGGVIKQWERREGLRAHLHGQNFLQEKGWEGWPEGK